MRIICFLIVIVFFPFVNNDNLECTISEIQKLQLHSRIMLFWYASKHCSGWVYPSLRIEFGYLSWVRSHHQPSERNLSWRWNTHSVLGIRCVMWPIVFTTHTCIKRSFLLFSDYKLRGVVNRHTVSGVRVLKQSVSLVCISSTESDLKNTRK